MDLRTIALRSIARRKGKAILIGAALAVGIGALVSIGSLTIAFNESISKELDEYGFNVVAYPASAELSISYGGMTISGVNASTMKPLTVSDVNKIRSLLSAGPLRAVSPKAIRLAQVRGKKVVVVGLDFKAERAAKKWWKVSNGAEPRSGSEVVVGARAAEALKLREGDSLALGKEKFVISGILDETGSQDDGVMFADLKKVWKAYGRYGEVDVIEMATGDSADVEKTVSAVSKALPNAEVLSVKQAVQYKRSAMRALGRFGLGATGFVMLISGFVVFLTLMGSVKERTSEIGVFRAIGFRGRDISRIFFIESSILSSAGGLVGSAGGSAAAALLPAAIGLDGLAVRLNPLVIGSGVLLSLAVGLLASIVPAKRAAELDPVEALKAL